MNTFKILLAAGGTGGHLFPAVSVLDAIVSNLGDERITVISIGRKDKIEYRIAIQRHWKFFEIPMIGFPGLSFKLFPFIYNTIRSVNICRRLIQENSIQCAIATGAYISYPVGISTKLEEKPLFLIEANIFPGKANRLLASRADIIFLGFEETKKWLPKDAHSRCQIVGVPVRPEILSPPPKELTYKKFGLDPQKKTLFVLGGSLGARSINLAMKSIYERLLKKGIQIIWQTGENFSTPFLSNDSLVILKFIEDMASALVCADLVVARAGASTIAELAVTGKPAIFVPYPFATNNHQEINAKELERNSAGVMIPDNELNFKLESAITSLIFDDDKLNHLSMNIAKYANTNSSQNIALEILKFMNF